MTTDCVDGTSEKRFIGQVKWFNNKSGYGFITYKDDNKDYDVFVHHSGIKVSDTDSNKIYKYLVQGEYVEFLVNVLDEDVQHKTNAIDVTGINEGLLMCQTRSTNFFFQKNAKTRKRKNVT